MNVLYRHIIYGYYDTIISKQQASSQKFTSFDIFPKPPLWLSACEWAREPLLLEKIGQEAHINTGGLRYLRRDIYTYTRNAIPLTFLDDPVDTPSDGSHLSEEHEGERPRWHLRHPSVLGALARQPRPNHLPKPQTQYNTTARKGGGRGKGRRKEGRRKRPGRRKRGQREGETGKERERKGEGTRNTRQQEGGRGERKG